MVHTFRIQKEVLHVNNYQGSRPGGNRNGGPFRAFCRRNVYSIRRVAGQIVDLVGLGIVPFVPRWAERDVWTHRSHEERSV